MKNIFFEKISHEISNKRVIVGFDGFIDTIVYAVDIRDGNSYTCIETISDFGKRISSASGKSCNIELVPQSRLIGGNGPLMANALHTLGAKVKYIGAIGNSEMNIFRDFAEKTSAVSIGDYSETRAVEFSDGKILFGEMLPLHNVTVDSILSKLSEHELVKIVDENHAFSITNWTMMPHMTEIVDFLIKNVFPKIRNRKVFFFDLADPQKRKPEELLEFLQKIQSVENFGQCILGLNLREATQVLKVLGESTDIEESKKSLISAAKILQEKLNISVIFIHALKIFVSANDTDCATSEGYFVENPKISTGAGDHCNAGFLASYLCNENIEFSTHFSAAVSAFYVKHTISPKLEEVKILI